MNNYISKYNTKPMFEGNKSFNSSCWVGNTITNGLPSAFSDNYNKNIQN